MLREMGKGLDLAGGLVTPVPPGGGLVGNLLAHSVVIWLTVCSSVLVGLQVASRSLSPVGTRPTMRLAHVPELCRQILIYVCQ